MDLKVDQPGAHTDMSYLLISNINIDAAYL